MVRRAIQHVAAGPPWPAVILSASLERYARTEQVVQAVGFAATWVPAIFVPTNQTSDEAWALLAGREPTLYDPLTGDNESQACPRTGMNAIQAAHRNVWRLIASSNARGLQCRTQLMRPHG